MPLANIIALCDDKLRSAALGSAADTGARDRALDQALVQYSIDAPRSLAAVVSDVATDEIALPSNWVPGRSRLVGVEYPIGRLPMAKVAAMVLPTVGGQQVVRLAQALARGTVIVHYTGPHALTDAECTVPLEHENAVACWAAAELCRQLATQRGHDRDATIGAAATPGQSQSGDLARRAKEWMAVYRTTLGLPDPDKEAGPVPAGTVVTFDSPRRRGRFASEGA